MHHHVRIETAPFYTLAIKLEAHNSLEYNYMRKLRFTLMEITKVGKPFIRRGANTFGNIV